VVKRYFLIALLLGISSNVTGSIDWSSPSTCNIEDSKNLDEIINQMTLRQKIGQIIMPDIQYVTPEEAKKYQLGSILNGGGSWPNNKKTSTVQDWQNLSKAYYDASPVIGDQIVPIIWGTDAVHGHSNVIGATVFPHNIGIGATQDTDLIKRIAEVVAKEVLSTGIVWTFAPTITVPQNDTWGRTYEGFSENQDLVSGIGKAFIEGVQGTGDEFLDSNHIMATAKHFIGDGGTFKGIDKGDTRISEGGLKNIHGTPYYSAFEACVQSVMASFNSWNGVKMHGHEYLLTDVLRNQMGFNGLVVGDWNGHGEVPGCTNANCPESFNAGVDIYMAPDEWKELYTNTVRAVKSGDISEDRLDDAVRKILTVKDRLGMLDGRKPHEYENYVGKIEHRELAREAVSKSLVLLKNNDNLLPLDSTKHFLVIGNAAVEIMNQMGGWTITWQGTELNRSDFPNTLSIYEALAEQVIKNGGSIEFSQNGTYKQKPDYVISVYGENPYAEFFGDVKDLSFKSSDLNYLNAMRKLSSESIPITSIFLSGRPLAVNKQINLSSAFIAAWLPGQAVEGIADVILKKDGKINKDFTGKLSFTWPKKSTQTVLNSNDPLSDHLFAFGYGLSYSDTINIPFLEEEEIIEKIESKIIFEGSPLNANEFVIENNKSPSIVNANLYTSPEKNISLKRFDLNQQYDSRNIVFNDSELMNAWGISFNENLVMSELSNPYVSIKFRVNTRSDDLLFFVATCGVNCSGAINLMDFLSDQNNNSWIEVDISYKCLEKSGLDLSKVYIPAMLMTSGKWDIDINKIVINKDRSSKRVIQC